MPALKRKLDDRPETKATTDEVYTLMKAHDSHGFRWLEPEDKGNLRALIKQTLSSRNVEALMDWFWNHDLVDCSQFDGEENSWEKALAVLRVDLELLLGAECTALPPAARAYCARQEASATEPTQHVKHTEAEETDKADE